MRILLLSVFLLLTCATESFPAVYYVASTGNDANAGTVTLPFLTIQRAQTAVSAGDTVYVRGGNYIMQESQIATYSGIWAYVTYLTKSGASGRRINYWAYPGEKPVFNYNQVNPTNYRINAFEVTGSWLHIKGLEVIGMQVNITTSNTQSICFSNNGGSNNIYEQLSMHDGQAIGFYLTRGANNLILNCDAYRNNDYTSLSGGGVNGGNVDGFGNHPNAGGSGNVFRGCRAWFNSDDGYDCISAHEPTVFENCWAFYNGYAVGFVSRADGNGFKAGGYGSTALTSLPATIPRNTIRFCLAVRNKSNGFYSNHHLEGSDWFNNTAYLNGANYNMLNRKAKTQADYLTDVPGYNHVMRNNISYAPRSTGSDLVSVDIPQCTIDHNSFLNTGIVTDAGDFLSLDTALLTAPRGPDGSLPTNNFMHLRPGSDLVDKGVDIGFPYSGAAPDLGPFETGTPLPVSLLQFNASIVNSSVVLNWQVATEDRNTGWQIERSMWDGTRYNSWQSIGFVPGKGNATQPATYTFRDQHVSAGKYGYRLKQIDLDGRSAYSSISPVSLSSATALNLTVYPNPVTSKTVISYSLPADSPVHISLHNLEGKAVSTIVDAQQQKGVHQVPVNNTLFNRTGTYVLWLAANGEVMTRVIVCLEQGF